MTNQLIALDPELGITAADFAQAWNDHEPAQQLGQLAPATIPPPAFLAAEVTTLVLTTAVAVGVNVLSMVIYDLLKEKYYRQEKPQILEIPQADGSKIIIIKLPE